MKLYKGLVAVASILVSVQAYAIPDFTTLAGQANGDGANITLSNFDHTPIAFDEVWNKLPGAAVKFKAERSGYKNSMGYANTDGTGGVTVLDEAASPGSWVSIAAAPDPFVFYLDTNKDRKDGSPLAWFSDTSLNTDGFDHMVAFQYADLSSNYILFWEDFANGGDKDYNDFVARVKFVQPVPEPGTLALLGLGLAGLSLSRRKQQQQ